MYKLRTSRTTISSWFITLFLLWASFGTFACSGPSENNNNSNTNTNSNSNENTNNPPPEGVSSLSVATAQITLPDAFTKEPGFLLGSVQSLGTLIGGDSGLFHLGNNKLSDIDNGSVVGIAPWRGQFLVIAQKRQLLVWDAELHESKLAASFGDNDVVAIAAQSNDVLWISTKDALWRLEDKKLVAFDSIKNVVKLTTFLGSQLVVAQREDGTFFVFGTDKEGSLQLNELQNNAPKLESFVPAADGTLWGLSNGKLVRRKVVEKGFQWDDVSWEEWTQEPQKLATSFGKLERLQVDVDSGRLWVVSEKAIILIQGKGLLWMERPEAIKTVKGIWANLNSTLWLGDGTHIHRFVQSGTTDITYEGQITTFMKNNCLRCHADVGPGRAINTYELVKKYAESIVEQLEKNAMPPDQKPLVGGDVLMFRRWIEKKMPK